jgi:hypothetical protein
MAKKSPLQIVKTIHGSKEQLVAKLVDLIEAEDGESKEEHAKRLSHVANAKLLKLLELGEKVKKLGGRTAIVAKVAELRGQAKDKDFVARLERRTLGYLVDAYESLTKAAKKAAAK